MERRRLIAGAAATVLARNAGATPAPQAGPVHIGLSPVFLDDQLAFLNGWRAYLEERLEQRVRFVQRRTYREIIDLLLAGKLEFAWICGYPYVKYRHHLQLVAVPVSDGRPTYHSYLVVPSSDRTSHSILDLRDRIFAFSDPDSNSGFLYPSYALLQAGQSAETFFGKTFFTWAHRNTVEAIAAGVAHGGAVDSYVWETLRVLRAGLTERTRVAAISPPFGHTPFVARRGVAASDVIALRRVLVDMKATPAGAALLAKLNLDGFEAGSDSLYEGIARMMQAVAKGGGPGGAPAA